LTRPEFTGNGIDIPELKYAEMDIIPGTHMKEQQGWGNESVAIMGNVAYPIDVPEGEELPKGIRELLHNNSFVIRFDIGDLDIAASREELSYDPRTIKNLIKKSEEIFAALEVYVVNKIKPAKTKWERNVLAAELIKSNEGLFGTIVENFLKKNKAKFVKGTKRSYSKLQITVPIAELDKVPDMKYTMKTIRKNYQDYTKAQLINIKTLTAEKPAHLKSKSTGGGYNPNDRWSVYSFDAANTRIVFNDEKGNVLARLRAAYIDDDYNDLFDGKQTLFIFQAQNKDADKKAIAKFLKTRFGNAPILLASQLPKPLAVDGGVGNTNVTVQRFITKRYNRYGRDGHTFDAFNGKMKDIEPTIQKGKKKTFLYLKLSHKSVLKPSNNGQTWDASSMMDLLENSDIASITGIDLDNVYGVNKTSLKTVTKDKRWVDFFDYIEEEFDKIDWKTARKETEHKIIGMQFNQSDYHVPKVADGVRGELAQTNSPIGILFKHWEDWKASTPPKVKKGIKINYDMLIRVMQEFFPGKDFTKSSAKLDVSKIEEKYEKIFDNVTEAYPMLRHLSLGQNYNADSNWREAIEYIKLVDSAS
jgi:hypothetical protein